MRGQSVRFRMESFGFRIINLRARFPFKYGIASMTVVPHLFLQVKIQIKGRIAEGVSSENLPPKWFTKDPNTTFEQDFPALLNVVTRAANRALVDQSGEDQSFFEHWQKLHHCQEKWAIQEGISPLLANLGVALVERAWIDALCRGTGREFASFLREDKLGIDLGHVRPELKGMSIRNVVPDRPLTSILIRHTVGLGDPLTEAEIEAADRVKDGLPQSLEASVRAYGLTRFKIKLSGDLEFDRTRLGDMKRLFERYIGDEYLFTLDGNENFTKLDHFIDHWNAYQEDSEIRKMMEHLLFIEQAIHRDHTLSDQVGVALRNWQDHPPLIIDESDAELSSLPRALELGYQGTSHKNCKGIVKGLANAALLKKRQHDNPQLKYHLSGEDLSNIGPVALAEDLAVMASLGISHVERNGHHYFRGLSMFPKVIQDRVLADHGDLYCRSTEGDFVTLRIREGRVAIESVVKHSFGVRSLPDLDSLTALESWDFASLGE